MPDDVYELWPELEWIENEKLRHATADTWALALDKSSLDAKDLNEIPFTLLIEDCKVTFMQHKRAVVHLARDCAAQMQKFFKDNLPIDMDVVIAANSANLSFFQNSQNFSLGRWAHIANFINKNRATLRLFEQTNPFFNTSRCSLLDAEKLALQ